MVFLDSKIRKTISLDNIGTVYYVVLLIVKIFLSQYSPMSMHSWYNCLNQSPILIHLFILLCTDMRIRQCVQAGLNVVVLFGL